LERATIEYNTKVVKVFSAESSSGQVIVTTDKDEKLSFDEVVMTTPLGWLKKNQAAFEPPLPTRFSQAIDALSYGCLEKVSRSLEFFTDNVCL
jgi:monoamine oxidase